MRLEFGPNGKDAVELSPGDFSIPPGLIHRDVNVSKKREALLANVLLGGAPPSSTSKVLKRRQTVGL